jgi:flagellar basal-body rod protein FlgF
MDRSLYVAMNGAKQTLLAQTANANNLANAQTTGFKADLEQFRSQPVFGAGYPTRVYAMTERPGIDFSYGNLQATGNDLDISVDGEGFIAVLGHDGNEAYTRAGDLRLTPEGLLKTGAGYQVLGQEGAISIPPSEKISIGQDGTISSIPLGSNSTTVAAVDRIKLIRSDMAVMEKGENGLFHAKDGKTLPANADVNVAQGVLEGSNVNAISAMVEMIELAKNFELQTKVMKNTNENAAAGTKLLQMI